MKSAIIGGTGVDALSFFTDKLMVNNNRYGSVYYRECQDIIYLPRHSKNHSVPPSYINYKANIECLRQLGVDKVISIYAVGSISEKLKPLEWGIVDDFMDFTGRTCTFYEGGEMGVKHVDMSIPFDPNLRSKLEDFGPKANDLIYVTTNGPRLETKAEISACRSLGGDVVGMTLAQEATLLKEAEIANASIAYSINWACGINGNTVEFSSDDKINALLDKILLVAREALMR